MGFRAPLLSLGAMYKATAVRCDVSRDEGNPVCVVSDIFNRLYVTTIVARAQGIFDPMPCFSDYTAGTTPRVWRRPTMIMPLIIWRVINDDLVENERSLLPLGISDA